MTRLGWRMALQAYATLWLAAIGGAAIGVAAPSFAGRLIDAETLVLPSNQAVGVDTVGKVALHNGVVMLAPLALLALGIHRIPRARRGVDAWIAAVLIANGGIVGIAFAVTGTDLSRYLVQLPLEWFALAVPPGAWFAARRSGTARGLISTALIVIPLAIGAAVLEVYATPWRW